MKTHFYIKAAILALLLSISSSCEDMLNVEVYSELNPESSSEEIITSILYNAYSNAQLNAFDGGIQRYYFSAMTSGESWNEGGSIARRWNQLRDYSWASDLGDFGIVWRISYQGIRDANTLLDNVTGDSNFDVLIRAEAKFIRGWLYHSLYDWFGNVPLRTSTLDEVYLPKASDEQIQAQIEQDLLEAAADLPEDAVEYGRADKGAAYGVLCKFYLNTKQWQKCADMAQTIIEMNKYALLPNYADIFDLNNEGNEELIWTLTRTSPSVWGLSGQYITAISFPPDYAFPEPNQAAYGANTYFFDDFLDSFDENDDRGQLFIRSYVNRNGQTIQLYGNDKSISNKYPLDPASNHAAHGNDMPEVRYADILLSRAEALNELNGPNQTSIDLINLVRGRANAPLLTLGDYPDQAALNAAILQEREWEFWGEAKGRQDQIRHGVLIERALARGKVNAKPHHVLFPIPLDEVNANPEVVQNEGY